MKHNIFILTLLLAAYQPLHCAEANTRPKQKSLPGRGSEKVAPLQLPEGAGVGFIETDLASAETSADSATSEHVPSLSRRGAVRGKTSSTVEQPNPITGNESAMIARSAQKTMQKLVVIAAFEKEKLGTETVYADAAKLEQEELMRREREKQRAQELATKKALYPRDNRSSAFPQKVSMFKEKEAGFGNIYNKLGYFSLPIFNDLIIPKHPTPYTEPARINIQMTSGTRTRLLLHSYKGTCYAVSESGRDYYKIVNFNDKSILESLDLNELLLVTSALTQKNIIRYSQLYCINQYMAKAFENFIEMTEEKRSTNTEIIMIIPGEDPYTIIGSGTALYAIQNSDMKKFLKAVANPTKQGAQKELFSLLLFNRLLHTPMELLYNRHEKFESIEFRARPISFAKQIWRRFLWRILCC